MIIYLIFPTIAQAAAIQYIARQRNGQNVTLGDGLKYGLLRFLPLFKYHLLIRTFGVFTILFEGAFVLRNLGMGVFKILLPLFILFAVIGLIPAVLLLKQSFGSGVYLQRIQHGLTLLAFFFIAAYLALYQLWSVQLYY